MKKLITAFFLLIISMAPGLASATIRVTISDGTNTSTSTNPPPGFALSLSSPAGTTNTLNLLTGCTAPCTRHFPSGNAVAQPTDTFRFQDISATSRARIIKTDSSTDRLELKGVKITSLTGVTRTLTITFETETGDFNTITSSSGSYPFSVALVGSFKGANGQLATACPNPATLTTSQLQTPCVKLLLQVNGITANGSGPSGIATASVPCRNGSVTPCATSGGSYSATGSFSSTDSSSISCGTTCSPIQKAIFSARFNALDQTITSANSGIGALSDFSDENFGFVELSVALANELDDEGSPILANQWKPYTASATELYRAVPLPPLLTNGGKLLGIVVDLFLRHVKEIPLIFALKRGELVAAETSPEPGVKLLSIGASGALSPTDLARYSRSYTSFVPAQPRLAQIEESEQFEPTGGLRFGNITTLKFLYDVITGVAESGDSRLGNQLFNDCVAGSIRVEIDLLHSENLNIVGPVVVYLGSEGNFKSGCDNHELSGNLVNVESSRVDASFLDVENPPECCITFAEAKERFGNFFVRSISFVVDQGLVVQESEPPVANYRVDFFSAQVNEITSAPDPTSGGFSLSTVDNFKLLKSAEFPTEGLSMKIFKLTGVAEPLLVKTVPQEHIKIFLNTYKAHVKKSDLQLNPTGTTTYRVEMCLFGGRCIPDQGFLTLRQNNHDDD